MTENQTINVYDLLRVSRHLQILRANVHQSLDSAAFYAARNNNAADLITAAREREAFQALEFTPEQIATLAAMPPRDITTRLTSMIMMATN